MALSAAYLSGVYLWSLAAMWVGLQADLDPSVPPEEHFPWPHHRLPARVRPDHYYIHLHPNLSSTSDHLTSDSLTGHVVILITALENTSFIVLNSKGLTIENATLTELTLPAASQTSLTQMQNAGPSRNEQLSVAASQTSLTQMQNAGPSRNEQLSVAASSQQRGRPRRALKPGALRVLESPSTEQLALLPEQPLIAGRQYQLSVFYSGAFSSGYSGIYKASYQTPRGDTRIIAATNFEPSAARQVFPCFDDPSMKALFSLVLVRHSQHISISNMPQLFTKPLEEDLVEDHYQTSVRMSSYLLAFVVGDFSVNSAKTKRGVKVSVFAASHQINQTDHALLAAVKILTFYEEYLQIPYPLPKLDLVALPDFESGAMENWGLVTFRETSLLIGQLNSLRGRLWVSLVTAHELAHQWFGNLVTMQWWNDLWLNEGFASYLEHIAVRTLQPDWGLEDQHLLRNVFPALEKDSLLSSHPVSQPVSCTTKIRQMFSAISYHKGASILGMLHSFVSDDVFIGGIRRYLSEHRYGNTQPDDLWKAMLEQARISEEPGTRMLDVKGLMDTWVNQRGYPVVCISIQGKQIHMRQDPFTSSPQNETESQTLWQIPLTFYTSSSPYVTIHLMKSKEAVLTLPEEVLWIKANVRSRGFYRVHYDRAILRALAAELQAGGARTESGATGFRFSPADRAGLIDDTFHLARQGWITYSDAFTFSCYLDRDEEELPITVFIKHMIQMIVQFSFNQQPCLTRLLKEHLWGVLGRQARAEPWEDLGSLPTQRRRVRLLELALQVGRSPEAGQEALRLFHFWMAKDGQLRLPLSLRGLIFRVGVWRGGYTEWSFLLQKYRLSQSSEDQVTMLAALCRTTNQTNIIWLLEAALQNHIIKTQDFNVIVDQLAFRPKTNQILWRFIQLHWEQLVLKFPLGSTYLSGIVTATTSHFNSTQKYDEVYQFFVIQQRLSHLSFVQRSLEIIQANMRWLQTNTKTIKNWLQKTYPVIYTAYPLCKKEVIYRFRWGTTIRFRA